MWTHFLGSLNDQTILFWFAWWRENYQFFPGSSFNYSYLYGAPTGWVVNYFPNQWLIWEVYYFISKYTSPIFAFNVLEIVSALLVVIISYPFFRKFFSKSVSLLSALLYLFCTYSIYKASNHIDLFNFWVIPLFLYFYYTYVIQLKTKHLLVSAFILGLTSFISNYYAFFLLVLATLSMIYLFIITKGKVKKLLVVKQSLLFFFVYTVTVTPFLFTFLQKTINNEKLPTGNYTNRPIEDYVTFSARPWHYILPSTQNPFVGNYVKQFYEKLEAQNYFLFNNYFPAEHGGAYLGIGNVVLFIVSMYLIYIKKSFQDQQYKINYSVFLLAGLFLFSMPPFFTFNGYNIYTPSYLIYLLLPVFRVTSRFVVIIYLLILVVNGYSWEKLKKSASGFWFVLTMFAFMCVHVVTSYVPIKTTDLSIAPKIYSYINETLPADSHIAVYPYSKTNEALYWMKAHKRGLVNPREYCNEYYCSENFTKSLPSKSGIATAKKQGTNYLVVFEQKNIEFFASLLADNTLSEVSRVEDVVLLKIN